MLKDDRRACTGAGCQICRHLARQRTAHAAKLDRGVETARRPATRGGAQA
jgi:hypothetical protein